MAVTGQDSALILTGLEEDNITIGGGAGQAGNGIHEQSNDAREGHD